MSKIKYKDVPKAGERVLTDDEILSVMNKFKKLDLDILEEIYFLGFTAGLVYPSVPSSAETHGLDAISFVRNGFNGTLNGIGCKTVVIEKHKCSTD